ncbi:MAG: hypothetical protein U0457_03565 [Candidatus Sericytochromatia bacterium]
MNKKIKLSPFFTLALIVPLSAFTIKDSSPIGLKLKSNINTKNKIALTPKNKTTTSKAKTLEGSWIANDGVDTYQLNFISKDQLDFNGEVFNYAVYNNAIRVYETYGEVDYKYSFQGEDLIITFPEGDQIRFKKVNKGKSTTNNKSNSGKNNNKTAKNNVDCNQNFLPAEVSGGCNITLITPRPCEEIDLSYGKVYEFAWQTGGSYCETPYKLYIAGNPVADPNTFNWSLSENVGKVSRKVGGIHYISAADLQGLSTNNGLYHWVVMGYYGSHPASQTFRVKF